MSTKLTMTDAAYNWMLKRKKEVEFSKLWAEVAKTMKIPEEKLSRKKRQFYAELMEDHRFAALKGNMWDLRSRRSFQEVNTQTEPDIDDDEISEDYEDRDVLDLPKGEDEY